MNVTSDLKLIDNHIVEYNNNIHISVSLQHTLVGHEDIVGSYIEGICIYYRFLPNDLYNYIKLLYISVLQLLMFLSTTENSFC